MTLSRVFDAPRELVFRVWSDPGHLKQWWGPKGFTLPGCEMDFRTGGAYRFVMRGPDISGPRPTGDRRLARVRSTCRFRQASFVVQSGPGFRSG
ncbi:MAG: SRPBCC domain-containing protein [Burkholderiales bacterium]